MLMYLQVFFALELFLSQTFAFVFGNHGLINHPPQTPWLQGCTHGKKRLTVQPPCAYVTYLQ